MVKNLDYKTCQMFHSVVNLYTMGPNKIRLKIKVEKRKTNKHKTMCTKYGIKPIEVHLAQDWYGFSSCLVFVSEQCNYQ